MILSLNTMNEKNITLPLQQFDRFGDFKTSPSEECNIGVTDFENKNKPVEDFYNSYFQTPVEENEKVYLESQICRLCGDTYSVSTMIAANLIKDKILECLHIKVDSNNYLSNMICNQCVEKLDNFKHFLDKCFNAEKKQLEIIKNHQNNCPICGNEEINQITFVSPLDFIETKNRHKTFCMQSPKAIKNDKVNLDKKFRNKPNISGLISKIQNNMQNYIKKSQESNILTCLRCKLSLNENEFKPHMEKHSYSNESIFFNSENLKIHSRIYSKVSTKIQQLTYNGNFYCELCSKSFKSKKRLEFHIEFHLRGANAGQCVICKKGYSSEIHFYKHMQHNHLSRKLHKCEHCSKEFRNKSSLKYHFRSHQNFDAMKPFTCNICNKRFVRKNILKDHMICQHGVEMDVQPNTCFQCRFCKELFPNTDSGISHMEIHHQNQINDKSGYSFNMQTIYKLYICEFCDKCYSLSSDLTEHRSRHSEPLKYQCKMCNEEFNTFIEMKTHLGEHVADGMNDYKSEFEVQLFYICEFCDSLFKSYHSFYNHIKSHTGINQYTCKYCLDKFSSYEEQQKHQMTHQKVENCNQSKNFLRPFKCQFCGKAFSSNSSLVKHIRVHTGEKPFQCQICSKTFAQRSGLNIHYKVHSNERPYKCNFCVKSFKIIGDYKKHVQRHSRSKLFSCSLCSKEFGSQRTLKDHVKNH